MRMQPSDVGRSFHLLLARLRTRVGERLADGELTERALARQAGLSQSHLHNVLKGIRALTPDVADRLMGALGWTLLDLMEPERPGGRTGALLHEAVQAEPPETRIC